MEKRRGMSQLWQLLATLYMPSASEPPASAPKKKALSCTTLPGNRLSRPQAGSVQAAGQTIPVPFPDAFPWHRPRSGSPFGPPLYSAKASRRRVRCAVVRGCRRRGRRVFADPAVGYLHGTMPWLPPAAFPFAPPPTLCHRWPRSVRPLSVCSGCRHGLPTRVEVYKYI